MQNLRNLEAFGRSSDSNPTVANIQANNRALMSAMGAQRRISGMRRTASEASTDVALAIPRFYDPLEYWDLSGLPWNMADEGHRHKLHKWLRLYYATHRLIPALVDIYTRYPLIGLNLYSSDAKITSFYEDLFLNQLQYEKFLVNLGREHWTVGEAFPLGSFNESLGVWEREELLNPEDIIIENFPLLGTRQIKVVPPEYLKRLASTKSPPDQYKQLEINFPDLIPYLRRGEPFPVSEVMLKQVAFKVTDWDDHGTPILLRALRTLLHEEKLLASQDAIAERMYSPMILAKLGIEDMGDNLGPWIPGSDQLDAFRDDMDLALASDFRLMVYHYGLKIENVFGREQVPDLWHDFDMVSLWYMQIFGLQGVMGSGASSQPYATSALNAELMNQQLRTYQYDLKQHMVSRMAVVAEAQEHFAYERRGQTRIPIMEEVVEYDEEGNPHIVERHKLLYPTPNFQTLDVRDEATQRMWLMSLRSMGVPISDQRLMVGVEFKFEDTLDELYEETIQKTVAQQMAKLQVYKILRAQGLTIPPQLQMEMEGGGGGGGGAPGGMEGPPGGHGGPGMGAGAPPGGVGTTVMPPVPLGIGGGGLPYGPRPGVGMGQMPGISSERMRGMPAAPPAIGAGGTGGLAKPMMASWAKTAGISDDELKELDEASDLDIDNQVDAYRQVIAEINFRKQMRTSNFERKFATMDIMAETTESTVEKITIDLVPPKVRREIQAHSLISAVAEALNDVDFDLEDSSQANEP
ncbi:hypothetical protein KGP36_07140 [Patescibacteria group bacterium]|nr:hypothetical protein [Patescibacteria group bacterium]